MKALVCVRFVGGDLQPFDACALELGLRLAEEVTVLSLGPLSAREPLRALTRLGVGRAILLSDPAFAGADTLATAHALAAAAKHLNFDCIFCGRTTTEGETGQVGPMLATLLGLPLFPGVMALSSDGLALRDGRTVPLPARALLTVERGFPLRFPSLRSRMGEAEVFDRAMLGLAPADCGLAASPTRVLAARNAAVGERHCRMISLSELPALLAALRTAEKRTAGEFPPSEKKLPHTVAVGEEALSAACAVGARVTSLTAEDPAKLAGALRALDPDAVFFPATDAGRNLAPQVAALLGAGLCADCTALTVREDRLILTRPARGGSTVADIICRSRPAMATVRCTCTGADVMLSGGLGVAGQRAAFLSLAARLGARPAASRPLVDRGDAPYAEQIGLTGANASCKVYLAVGLSGAVQHTCALGGADTVIAVNPDRSARIFSCADYGVCATFQELCAAFFDGG